MTENAESMTTNLEKIPERVETAITHKLDEYGRRSFGIIQKLEETSLHNNVELKRIVGDSLHEVETFTEYRRIQSSLISR